jgi:hypothetical protein
MREELGSTIAGEVLSLVKRRAPTVPSARFAADGFEVFPYVLSEPECRLIAAQVSSCGTTRAGARTLLMHPWCRELAGRLRRHFGIARRLPGDAVAVQCTLFDKSTQRNWHVAMHQDLSVPVLEQADPEPGRPAAHEDGLAFVQPPMSILEALVVARLHLDDCADDNGALRVVPGSHRCGRLAGRRIEALRATNGELVCPVPRGGVMLMRPLLLHASSKSFEPGARRVLHFVFGPANLPEGLRWAHT